MRSSFHSTYDILYQQTIQISFYIGEDILNKMYSLIVNIGNMWHFQTRNTIAREKEKNYDELE